MQLHLVIVLTSLFAYCRSDVYNRTDSNIDNIPEIKTLSKLSDIKSNLSKTSDMSRVFLDSSILFYVYTQSSIDATILNHDQSNLLASVKGFSTEIPTVFIIHGWVNNYESHVNTYIRDSLLEYADVNVISVDWSCYSFLEYCIARSNVPNVGRTVGQFIKGMIDTFEYSPKDIILLGHSLGAHVSGFAGKALNGTLGTIVGMDPAGPLFFIDKPEDRLNPGDAEYVQAIHTNAGGLGAAFSLGDADFWPNGGSLQPPCSPSLKIIKDICSHDWSYVYMAESIKNNKYYAKQCSTYNDYCYGACDTNPFNLMGGLDYDKSAKGNFYLKIF